MSAPPSDPRVEAALLYDEARSRRAEGNLTGAFARYRRVLEAAETLDDHPWRATLVAEIAQMYQDAYNLPEARRWYRDALALFRELGDERQVGPALYGMAQVEQLSGDTEAAERFFREALEQARRVGDRRSEGLAQVGLGHLLWEMKQEREGPASMVAGLQLLREEGLPEAESALEKLREWRSRVGPVRYRGVVAAVVEDADLRALLLG